MAIIETENRIIGRTPVSYDKLVKEIVDRYGTCGGNVSDVLLWQCKKRNLDWKNLYDISLVISALELRRVVVGTFWLTEQGWDNFGKFFAKHGYPNDLVIRKCDIAKLTSFKKSFKKDEKIGHAVVITGFGKDKKHGHYLTIKNSWGENFGDNGQFRIMPDALGDMKYYDVYFTIDGLSQADKKRISIG